MRNDSNSARRLSESDTDANPVVAAQSARLRYVRDWHPGIRRKRRKKSFLYIGVNGKPLRNREHVRWIKSLAIPPAWRDVWICPWTDGHLQATGRDGRGRKQYRYHSRWRAVATIFPVTTCSNISMTTATAAPLKRAT